MTSVQRFMCVYNWLTYSLYLDNNSPSTQRVTSVQNEGIPWKKKRFAECVSKSVELFLVINKTSYFQCELFSIYSVVASYFGCGYDD